MILASDPSIAAAKRRNLVLLAIVIGGLVVVSSLAGAYVLLSPSLQNKSSSSSTDFPVAAQVSIKVYNGSKLVSSVTQNSDMVMNNFLNFLASWLTYVGPSSAPASFTMTDTSGTARTLVGRVSLASPAICSWVCETSTAPYAGGYIGVGTSSTAPARTDYKLTSQYQSSVTVTQPTYDPSTGNIIFGVGIVAGTAVSISEVGFFENWYTSGGLWANFLMFHDTFTAINVSAGNTISVQYTVQLGSTAFNNNLGTLLAAIFANPLGALTTVKLTPTSGAAQTVTVYSPVGNNFVNPYGVPRADIGSGATGADSAIRVGTGSASNCPNNGGAGFAESRSATDLCNPVLGYQPVLSYMFSPYVAVTAVISTTAAYSFTEAGYYQSFGSPSYSFLLMRNTFSAVNVGADSSITTTYEVSMS